MNTVSDPVSVCPLERNVLVSAYFGVLFQGVSELPLFYNKKYILLIKKKNSYKLLRVLKKLYIHISTNM